MESEHTLYKDNGHAFLVIFVLLYMYMYITSKTPYPLEMLMLGIPNGLL